MLVVDDGSFSIGNTFLLLTDVDLYHEVRLTTPWNKETEDDKKEAAIIRGFDYLKIQNWDSSAFLADIPIRIEEALCVAANEELNSPGAMQKNQSNNIKKEKIAGAIETEYFSKNASSSTIFTKINDLIAPYLDSASYAKPRQRFLVRM